MGKPKGGVTWNTGWPMGTLWGRMGHPKCMAGADPAFPEYRKIIVDQFARLAQIGADGVHVDKMFPVAIDYNPNLPMSPDTGPWEGAILLTKEVFAACRKYNPDWAMSFECNWDRMLQFTGATWWVGNQLHHADGLSRERRDADDRNGLRLPRRQQCGARGAHGDARADEHVPLGRLEALGRPGGLHQGSKADPGQLADTVFLGELLGQEGMKMTGGPAPASHTMSSATSARASASAYSPTRPWQSTKQAIAGFEASLAAKCASTRHSNRPRL